MLPFPDLRILLDYRPALRQRTGVGEYVHEMAAALARRLTPSDRLLLFSSSWKDRLAPGLFGGTDTIDAKVPVRVLNWAWHRLEWPPVERFAGSVDIAHSLHPLLMPSRGGRQVVTIHDLDFMDYPERARAEIGRDYQRLAPLHARRAAAVVTVSEFTAREIVRRFGVARDRIVLCPPGAPRWTPRAQPVPRGPILFVGTLEPRKNVGTLLKAYAMLLERDPSVPPLWIAGGRTEASGPWLRAIEEPPLAGHVKYLGYIQSDDRYALYVQSSMLILPSHLEGFGITAVEAMAAGVPTVLSRRGALPEVAGDAAAFVEPDDIPGLAAAMRRYLEDPEAAAVATARGLARAARYSWDASAATLLDCYRQIA